MLYKVCIANIYVYDFEYECNQDSSKNTALQKKTIKTYCYLLKH